MSAIPKLFLKYSVTEGVTAPIELLVTDKGSLKDLVQASEIRLVLRPWFDMGRTDENDKEIIMSASGVYGRLNRVVNANQTSNVVLEPTALTFEVKHQKYLAHYVVTEGGKDFMFPEGGYIEFEVSENFMG